MPDQRGKSNLPEKGRQGRLNQTFPTGSFHISFWRLPLTLAARGLHSLEHPAVVTGKWENGHIRRELVRVSDDFEIAEYSSEEAPRTFTVRDLRTELCKTVRTVDEGRMITPKWFAPTK